MAKLTEAERDAVAHHLRQASALYMSNVNTLLYLSEEADANGQPNPSYVKLSHVFRDQAVRADRLAERFDSDEEL